MSTTSSELHTVTAREPKPIIPALAGSYPQLREFAWLREHAERWQTMHY